jgi:hypothetical protein
MAKQQWSTISLKPLSSLLDVRSRPADIPAGALRWRLNFSTSSEGKLCVRDGFSRAFSDLLFDSNGDPLSDPNHTGTGIYFRNPDWHSQGGTREPITMQFESTGSDGTRRHFAGTKSRISYLNEATGDRTVIASGLGGGTSYWTAAELQDKVVFANGVDNVLIHTLGTSTTATIPTLVSPPLNVTMAHIAIEYQGVIFLMNITELGQRKPFRVRWCDLNDPTFWLPNPAVNGGATSIASFQDLDYGDEILAAEPLLGALMIYTRRSIWRVTPAASTTNVWAFTRVYNEPKNQIGCLLYPRSVINTGDAHYYLASDSIYMYNPYIAAPRREEWTRRADGVIYKKLDTALSGVLCNAPCGNYRPNNKELWFSWPSGTRTVNNWTLVLNIEQSAADVVDHGFSSFVNFRRTPTEGLCNETQFFMAASGTDYAIKQIGGVFYRELLVMPGGDPTVDLNPIAPPTMYQTYGYSRQLRGMIPLGFGDRNKTIRNVLLDHDTSFQDKPCVVKLRIGNSYTLTDPNDFDDVCAPQWRVFDNKELSCPTPQTNTALQLKNQKPYAAMEWVTMEENRFLFFELTIENKDGTLAIGADSCWERIDFEAMARVPSKP